MRKRFCVVIFFGLVLANALSLLAQNNTARLTGTITDSSGGAILAAGVSVTNTGPGFLTHGINYSGALGAEAMIVEQCEIGCFCL